MLALQNVRDDAGVRDMLWLGFWNAGQSGGSLTMVFFFVHDRKECKAGGVIYAGLGYDIVWDKFHTGMRGRNQNEFLFDV